MKFCGVVLILATALLAAVAVASRPRDVPPPTADKVVTPDQEDAQAPAQVQAARDKPANSISAQRPRPAVPSQTPAKPFGNVAPAAEPNPQPQPAIQPGIRPAPAAPVPAIPLAPKAAPRQALLPAAPADNARPRLGIHMDAVTPELCAKYGCRSEQGVFVVLTVEGSAAEKGGLREGDCILAVGATGIDSPDRMKQAIDEANAGPALITILRNGKKMQVTCILPGDPTGVGDHF